MNLGFTTVEGGRKSPYDGGRWFSREKRELLCLKKIWAECKKRMRWEKWERKDAFWTFIDSRNVVFWAADPSKGPCVDLHPIRVHSQPAYHTCHPCRLCSTRIRSVDPHVDLLTKLTFWPSRIFHVFRPVLFVILYFLAYYLLIFLFLVKITENRKKGKKHRNKQKYRLKSYFQYDLFDIRVCISSLIFHINSKKNKKIYVRTIFEILYGLGLLIRDLWKKESVKILARSSISLAFQAKVNFKVTASR